ncbi:MarR family transcriptional regulator [Ktedonosporobacter rubrisoli]|uniref:MarR family transcriptional regulator n=1 Tax=Ktedonosporobacter rubrisoli TaxID=2509675 RepID=A0A4P6JZ99_KTERU|nr:MarR family winged helix-turn-helix transcriptional regulator [Ktedonosporobacter rubrisoli]QBD81117.1 MarR family transcriptional regulator [Ktedonosporobacter rubrisoli]
MSQKWHSEEGQGPLPAHSSPAPTPTALMNLFDEVVLVHQRLQIIIEALHGTSELTRACRGILRDLYRLGPRTVPQLARHHPVSRQNVRMLVQRLAKEGIVELVRNPEHRRSYLVRLTSEGKTLLEEMWGREMALLESLELDISLDDLRTAASVLQRLRTLMDDFVVSSEEARG